MSHPRPTEVILTTEMCDLAITDWQRRYDEAASPSQQLICRRNQDKWLEMRHDLMYGNDD